MKRMLSRWVLVAGLSLVGAARAELVYLVEVSDIQRKNTYQTMSQQEFRTLKKTVDAESRVFQKALEQARKDWDSAEKGPAPVPGVKAVPAVAPAAPIPFPGGSLSTRKVIEKASFTDAKKAEQRQRQLEDAQRDIESKEIERLKNSKNVKADKARREHQAAADRAALIVQTKIDELVKAAGTPAPSGKPDAGTDAKPADAAK